MIEAMKVFASSDEEIPIPTQLTTIQEQFLKHCLTKNPQKRTQSITELIGTPFLKANMGTQTSIFEDFSSKLPWSTLPKCIALEKQSVGGKEVIKVCTIKLPRPMFAKEMENSTEIQKEMSKSPEMMTQQQGEALKEIGEFLKYLDGETFSKQIESIDVIENKTMERSMTLSTLPGLSKVSKLSPQIPHWTSADAVYQPGQLHINGDTPNIDEWISARTRVFQFMDGNHKTITKNKGSWRNVSRSEYDSSCSRQQSRICNAKCSNRISKHCIH